LGVFSFQEVTTISFLLAVDTAAVRLAVHPDLFRNPNAFGPAFAEILIEKGNPLGSGHTLCDLPDKIVLLIATVEEGRRKGVISILYCNPRGIGKPEMIAEPATFFLPEDDLSQICIERIVLFPDDG